MGKTDFGGVLKQVCLEYTPDIQSGDYVLVHVGFALGKVDRAEAERTYKLLEEMNQLGELEATNEPAAEVGFLKEGSCNPQDRSASAAASVGGTPVGRPLP